MFWCINYATSKSRVKDLRDSNPVLTCVADNMF